MFETYEVREATYTDDKKALAELMATNNLNVLRAIAGNESTYKKHLKALARHTDAEVRSQVASNENTAPAVLGELAKDADSEVRFYAALNGRTPREALETLLGDSDKEVARMARININALDNEGRRRKHGSPARFVSNAIAVQFGWLSLPDASELLVA